ncbi:transposase [Streptomyces sp. NPDC050548]|uniref:transposase n=1 Tax=Streptomyces sp. NPDC050548 TaxID=3365629 RepID=UPI0037BDEC94
MRDLEDRSPHASPAAQGTPRKPCPARAEQKTDTWKNTYAPRAGVEGTANQALNITGIRRARDGGLPKGQLQHAFSAVALNAIRLDAQRNSAADPDRSAGLG